MKKIIRDIITVTTIAMLMVASYLVGTERDTFLPSKTDSVSQDAGSVYISTAELQRKLNKQYPEAKLVIDGACGPLTQQWWNRAYGDQNALALWPK